MNNNKIPNIFNSDPELKRNIEELQYIGNTIRTTSNLDSKSLVALKDQYNIILDTITNKSLKNIRSDKDFAAKNDYVESIISDIGQTIEHVIENHNMNIINDNTIDNINNNNINNNNKRRNIIEHKYDDDVMPKLEENINKIVKEEEREDDKKEKEIIIKEEENTNSKGKKQKTTTTTTTTKTTTSKEKESTRYIVPEVEQYILHGDDNDNIVIVFKFATETANKHARYSWNRVWLDSTDVLHKKFINNHVNIISKWSQSNFEDYLDMFLTGPVIRSILDWQKTINYMRQQYDKRDLSIYTLMKNKFLRSQFASLISFDVINTTSITAFKNISRPAFQYVNQVMQAELAAIINFR